MPLLETMAAVASIVSSFEAALALYNGFKARREAAQRAQGPQPPSKTKVSLLLGRRRVKEEFDRGVARYGQRFARGDEECRVQLFKEIINLQATVIKLLQNANKTGVLDVTTVFSASERRRTRAIRAIVNQFHRMAASGPMVVTLRDPTKRADYFAFASNLSLQQMAKRCPTSLYRGKATLYGYRWQINERGFANIVESPVSNVEGLVFAIGTQDEETLDRYEGVRKGYYEQRCLQVRLDEHKDGPWKTPYVARSLEQGQVLEGAIETKDVNAFVYISYTYIDEGRIREEYAERMKQGVADALRLGISKQYVQSTIMPHIRFGPRRARPRQPFSALSLMSLRA